MERRNLCTLPRGGWLALFTLAITLLGGATPAEAQAGGPITELECEVTAPDSVVLNWVNDGPYTEIRIIIDGVLWDTLGGAETSKELNGITPGVREICVVGVDAGVVLGPIACCLAAFGGIPPIDNINCQFIGPNNAQVTWNNIGVYSSIRIELDGVFVASIPGGATSFPLTGLSFGLHEVCVTALIAGTPVEPESCCQIFVPPPIAIDNLACTVVAPGEVALSWLNGGMYTSIDIALDGVLIDTVPGTTTTYLLTGLAPGGHVVCLRAFAGTTPIPPDACCQFSLGSPQAIDPLNCDPISGSGDVALAWTNGGAYDTIELYLDGALIDTLPGGAMNTVVTGLLGGTYEICVVGVIGGVPILPPACCIVTVDGIQPIDPLLCDPISGTADVALFWSNPSLYDEIEVTLNGVLIASIPGTDNNFVVNVLVPGTHVICVRGVVGGVPILPEACCTVTVGNVGPIPDLHCEPVPGAPGIALTWMNDGVYTSIDVEVDGVIVATLGGTETSYLLTGLGPGGHVVCLHAYDGPTLILPVPCCQFTIGSFFRRGDGNTDGAYDISDPVHQLTFLFSGGPAPTCGDASDSNDDGMLNVADAVFSLGALFGSGPMPPAPFPGCGLDPTVDLLNCGSYPCP